MRIVLFLVTLSVCVMGQNVSYTDSLTEKQLMSLDSFALSYTMMTQSTMAEAYLKYPQNGTLVSRLYNYTAWHFYKNTDLATLREVVNRREQLYRSKTITPLGKAQTSVAGDPKSPIEIVMFMTTSCPSCKQVGMPLYELATGPYRGRFSFVIKPINHTIGDVTLLAADEFGKQWKLFMALGLINERLDQKRLEQVLQEVGIDPKRMADVVTAKESYYNHMIQQYGFEGRGHGLKTTPYLFIGGHRYTSNKHPVWILDYVEWLEQTKAQKSGK